MERRSMNKILESINESTYQTLFSQLEPVSHAQGAVIYEAESPIDYVYFPETSVFSMLSPMEDGRTVEVGPVGNEGDWICYYEDADQLQRLLLRLLRV